MTDEHSSLRPVSSWIELIKSTNSEFYGRLEQIYGDNEDLKRWAAEMCLQALEAFNASYGGDRSVIIVRSTGRVNLLGTHVDHRGGSVNPICINDMWLDYLHYLRIKDEVARIEVPQWVAVDEDLLTLVHTLVLDQCHRGQGYPVALSEAHEKAVVTGADRENFWHLVESSLVKEHVPSFSSAKSQSKRTRWV